MVPSLLRETADARRVPVMRRVAVVPSVAREVTENLRATSDCWFWMKVPIAIRMTTSAVDCHDRSSRKRSDTFCLECRHEADVDWIVGHIGVLIGRHDIEPGSTGNSSNLDSTSDLVEISVRGRDNFSTTTVHKGILELFIVVDGHDYFPDSS